MTQATTEQMLYWLDSIIHAEHTEIDTVRGTATKIKIPYDPMILAIRLRLTELTSAIDEARSYWKRDRETLNRVHAALKDDKP